MKFKIFSVLLLSISLIQAGSPSASYYGSPNGSHTASARQSHNGSSSVSHSGSYSATFSVPTSYLNYSFIEIVDLLIEHVKHNVPGARQEALDLCSESGLNDLLSLRAMLELDQMNDAPFWWKWFYRSAAYKRLAVIRDRQHRGYYVL